jgi:hypothetical protein
MDLEKIFSGQKIINLVHVFGVGLMFLIIGFLNRSGLHTYETGTFLYIMALVIMLYHSYLYITKYIKEFNF